MMGASRPVRPGLKPQTHKAFVVLKPMRIKGEPKEIGSTVSRDLLPLHVLRYHYNQRKLGPAGDRWTEYQLWIHAVKVWRANGERGDRPQTPEWMQEVHEKQIIKPAAQPVAQASSNPDLDALELLQSATSFAKHVGGGHFEVTRGYVVERVKGKEAVRALGVEVS